MTPIIGSFDGEELVGFALSIPGSRGGNPYLHSHMLAVRDKYRNAGLGKQMKLLHPEVPIVIFSGAVDLVNAMDGLRGTKTADLLLPKGAGPTEMLVSLSRLLNL